MFNYHNLSYLYSAIIYVEIISNNPWSHTNSKILLANIYREWFGHVECQRVKASFNSILIYTEFCMEVSNGVYEEDIMERNCKFINHSQIILWQDFCLEGRAIYQHSTRRCFCCQGIALHCSSNERLHHKCWLLQISFGWLDSLRQHLRLKTSLLITPETQLLFLLDHLMKQNGVKSVNNG